MSLAVTQPRFGALYQLSPAARNALYDAMYDTSDQRDQMMKQTYEQLTQEPNAHKDFLILGSEEGHPYLMTHGGDKDDVQAFRSLNASLCQEKTPSQVLTEYLKVNGSRVQFIA